MDGNAGGSGAATAESGLLSCALRICTLHIQFTQVRL